nr:hypothetical protein [Tanacetum cinerariifolium]
MLTLKFAEVYNLVLFLSKPTKCEGFEQIVDFLNANHIKYALTVNPTVYTWCIEQFWATVKAKTVNGEGQLQALVDEKKVIITESTIRRDLQSKDAEGVDCLPNAVIFEQLTLMGTMASAIICLSKNQKFNFSKYIFESMVKNLDNVNKFLMYLRNMKRVGKGFSGKDTPLFPTMMVQAQEDMGEGNLEERTLSYLRLVFLHVLLMRLSMRRWMTVWKRAVTTATSLDAEQDRATLAQALAELKYAKPKAKVKGIVFHEPEESTTTTVAIPKPRSHDKGKAETIKEPVKLKKKDQIQLDEELALKLQAGLQAKFDKEQRLTTERAQ